MFAQWLKQRRKLIPDPKAPALFGSATGCAGSQAQPAASTSLWYRSLLSLTANRIHGSHTSLELSRSSSSAGTPSTHSKGCCFQEILEEKAPGTSYRVQKEHKNLWVVLAFPQNFPLFRKEPASPSEHVMEMFWRAASGFSWV